MKVDTLLTRQMELHSSTRRPPKTPEQLMELRETLREYSRFFSRLQALSTELQAEQETVFQCFMHISFGGAVNFDRQHQDGSVPMHQAKVLARAGAIQLEPSLRVAVPQTELMVLVGLSKDLRNTLRVKVEDGNDLRIAEKSVGEAIEYLDFIHTHSHGDASKMFAFYMVEDAPSLVTLLQGAAEHGELDGTLADSLSTFRETQSPLLGGSGTRIRHGLPLPLSTFVEELAKQCLVAGNPKESAPERLRAANVILDWMIDLPEEVFAERSVAVVTTLTQALRALTSEKRSALCRMGCEILSEVMHRLSTSAVLRREIDDTEGETAPMGAALAAWTAPLVKGVFVTVAAIATATDKALRDVVVESHGHMAVVKAILHALESGTQTELRRKCLGYLALSASAALATSPHRRTSVRVLLVPVAQKYVGVGDSPSRKMARALCAVLRATTSDPVRIPDDKIERLIQLEGQHVRGAVANPRALEQMLFESDDFVSSMRSPLLRGPGKSFRAAPAEGTGRRAPGRSGPPRTEPLSRGGLPWVPRGPPVEPPREGPSRAGASPPAARGSPTDAFPPRLPEEREKPERGRRRRCSNVNQAPLLEPGGGSSGVSAGGRGPFVNPFPLHSSSEAPGREGEDGTEGGRILPLSLRPQLVPSTSTFRGDGAAAAAAPAGGLEGRRLVVGGEANAHVFNPPPRISMSLRRKIAEGKLR